MEKRTETQERAENKPNVGGEKQNKNKNKRLIISRRTQEKRNKTKEARNSLTGDEANEE